MFEKERTIEIIRKEAPYAPDDELGEYKLKRWTWFQKQQAMEKAATIIDAEKKLAELSMSKYNIQMFLTCIIKAPFEVTEEKLHELDEDVGDRLFNEFQTLNSVGKEKKKDFLSPPG